MPRYWSVPGHPDPLMDTTRAPGSRKPRRIRAQGEAGLTAVTISFIMVFIVVLLVIPIIVALVGSFHQWNPLNGTFTFIGWDNYHRLFSDPTFAKVCVNTILFTGLSIVGRVVLGLAVAMALFSKLTRWKGFFRTIFYMPTITPLVAVAYVWKLMYNPQFGIIDHLTGLDLNWLYDSRFSMIAVVVMTIWKDFGYAVILFLSALYAVPEDALEAASVDGAGSWQRFRYVILPLLQPMVFFVVITSAISYLQAFVQIMVMTKGGPGTSTQIVSYMIYDQAFVQYNFGYASAIAFVLLLFTAVLTALSWRFNGVQNTAPRAKRSTKRRRQIATQEAEVTA